MTNKIILIDGENTVHKLVEALRLSGQNSDRDNLLKLNLSELLCSVLNINSLPQAQYYTARVKQNRVDPNLQKKTKQMIAWNAKWAPWLQNQGIQYIKSGALQIRDSKRCQHCGKTSLVLQEKGVDVRLATDILQFSHKGQEIVVVSSDSDLIPAIQAAKERGANVIYVGFSFAINRALVATCSKTITIDDSEIRKFL